MNSTFSSFIFEDIVFVHVWLWKAKLWLMFLSTHSFQNLSPSWAQLLNLMGSLMSIFKKILPIPSSAVPSGRSAAPNVASSQNICHSYSLYCWGLCAFSIDHILIVSITRSSIYILQPLPLSPVSSDSSYYSHMWLSLTFSVYLNLTYILWPRMSPIYLSLQTLLDCFCWHWPFISFLLLYI